MRLVAYGALVLAAVAMATFWGILAATVSTRLPLGSIHYPTLGYGYALLLWTMFGGVAALFGCVAITRIGGALAAHRGRLAPPLPERTFLSAAVALGFALPALCRALVLGGAPVVDDEGVYRFAAELLASGRLWADSPPGELFWDRAFMVNDGRWYTQYFLGWPALMVPFLLIGAEGYANAAYAALGVPAVYLATRELAGVRAARWTTVVYVTAPLLAFSASTMMSHTSCITVNAWALLAYLRTRRREARPRDHVGFALLLSLGVFVRPLTTFGLGAPLVLVWIIDRWRGRREERIAPWLAFALPSLALAGLFLLVNHVLTGSPFYTAYQAAQDYAIRNDFRFSHLGRSSEVVEMVNIRFDVLRGFVDSGVSLLRFNYAAFGWPSAFLFLLAAPAAAGARLPWAMFASFLAFHFLMRHSGVDTFGPPHHVELVLPVAILTGIGVDRATHLLASVGSSVPWLSLVPRALLVSLVVTSTFGYTTLRILNLSRIADAVRIPTEAVERSRISDAVIFRTGPFVAPCATAPTSHYVLWPPHNDPDLTNDVLWANHLTVSSDRGLLEALPGDRRGYVAVWSRDCTYSLLPLEQVDPETFPASPVVGSNDE